MRREERERENRKRKRNSRVYNLYPSVSCKYTVLFADFSLPHGLRDSKSDVFIGFSTCNQSLAHLDCFVARSEKWEG